MDPAAYARLQENLLRWAAEVMSGPDGLAAYLRTGLLDGALAAPSIVLDVGTSTKNIPTALERTVRRRDQRCRFPGCDHPAELSQVHHIVPRSKHGLTQLQNLLCLCPFHHLTAVHTWGWTITLNGDGTVTARHTTGRTLQDTHTATRPPSQAA
jgi:hypothetical protein